MEIRRRLIAAVTGIVWGAILVGTNAGAAEIKCFFPAALRSAAVRIVPRLEQATGNKVLVEYGAVGALAARVQKGEPGDVAILSDIQIEDLQKSGKILAGTKVSIAKVGIGMFVAKSSTKPDIGTAEAFKRALIAAKSISFGNPANGAPAGVYLVNLIERLGLTAELKPKIVLATSGTSLFESVAKGDVELGFNQITEIIADDKVQLVGPLPSEMQNYTRFAGGVMASSRQPELGKALLSQLSSSDSQSAMKLVGLDPP